MKLEEYRQLMTKGKNKYNAQKTEYNGVIYDSKAEARRAQELDILLASGYISDLKRQEKLDFFVNNKKMFTYIPDFTYFDNTKQIHVYEDVKGVQTPVFRIKKKCIEAYYNIKIDII